MYNNRFVRIIAICNRGHLIIYDGFSRRRKNLNLFEFVDFFSRIGVISQEEGGRESQLRLQRVVHDRPARIGIHAHQSDRQQRFGRRQR